MPSIKYQQSRTQRIQQAWLTQGCNDLSDVIKHKTTTDDAEYFYKFSNYCGLINSALQYVHAFNNRYAGLD